MLVSQIPLSRRLIRLGLCPQGYKFTIAAASLHSLGNTNRLYHKIPQELILWNLQNSEKYKMSQLQVNDNIEGFNDTNSLDNVQNNSTVADQKSEILAWLSRLGPSVQHQDIQAHRADGVGDWLLQTEEYQNWIADIPGKSDGSALFCYGGSGVGKTYIR